MAGFLSPIGMGQWFTDQGVVLAGGKVNTYIAGTTTPAATYTTSALSVANANPIILDSAGRAPQEIWIPSGTSIKIVVTDSNGNAISNGTFDNISGINDTGTSNASEWTVSGSTPTYVSGTQFTVPGNQTTTFTVNRRVYASVSAGTVYGSITASSYSAPNTTVTVAWDSGALDSGLTQVAYALLNITHPSFLALLNVQVFTSSGTYTPTNGAVKAIVEFIGGGGAGGGAQATGAGQTAVGAGGGAGAHGMGYIASGLTTQTITVGSGGTGSSGASGGNGGNSSFGSIFTAQGGQGGNAGAAATAPSSGSGGGAGGGVSGGAGGTLIMQGTGQGGQIGFSINTAIVVGGSGGGSAWGSGGNANSGAAAGLGAGGAGAGIGQNAAAAAGFNGSSGIVIVYEYA
jgi:hypothetical protein